MMRINPQKGFSLIATLILGAVAIMIVSALIGFANTNLSAGRRALASEQAFRSAEAGIKYYKWLLERGGSLSSPTTFDFRDRNGVIIGSYELIPTPDLGSVSIISHGRAGGVERTIEAQFIEGDGVSFHYGVQSGNGGFDLGNGSRIVGSVYSNGNISGGNNTFISGDAFAVGSISGVEVGGESSTGVSAQPFPISDELIAEWKDDADAVIHTGNVTISGENNTLGPRKIVGNLIISGGASLLLTDTVWVTGSITISNGASVTLSSSYGSGSGIIIADGPISINNNSILDGSGQSGSSLLLISTSSSDSAITVNNNNSSAILFAPNGNVSIRNNGEIDAVTGNTVSLGNNVVLEYDQGIINPAFRSGPSGGWEMVSWQEIQ